MSISNEDRVANHKHALALFLEQIGDRYYNVVFLQDEGEDYSSILPTTWQDLVHSYDLRELLNGQCYKLTAAGWRAALEQTGKLDDPEFIKSLGRISGAMKDRVKGRREPSLASTDEVAAEAKVPLGLVQSVIDSNLLSLQFRQTGAEWASPDDEYRMIFIPVNFGLDLL